MAKIHSRGPNIANIIQNQNINQSSATQQNESIELGDNNDFQVGSHGILNPEDANPSTFQQTTSNNNRSLGALGAFAFQDVSAVASDEAGCAPMAGEYTLPSGGNLMVMDDGMMLYEPASDMETLALEQQGFEWAGETGAMSFPKKSGPETLLSGSYQLPDGNALYIHNDGSFMFEPGDYDNVGGLEAQGFRWAGETGMLEPPEGPGTYELPNGASLMVRENGEMLIGPGGDMDTMALEHQGFSWAGESGMLSFPQKSGPETRASGSYQLPGGDSLYIHTDGSFMFEPGNYDNVSGLEAQGLQWAGESGMLELPTE